jgi:site-specific DNA-methyltransferase (cytosine-N4-specific)
LRPGVQKTTTTDETVSRCHSSDPLCRFRWTGVKWCNNQPALQAAILTTYFSHHGGAGPNAPKNRNTLAMNSRLGLKAYGVIDEAARFTDLGRRLFNLRADANALYQALARHILLNLHGMALIQCIRDMLRAPRMSI